MPTHSFRIAPEDFDTSLLPENARKVGSFRFREAVNDYLKQEFRGFGGSARIERAAHRRVHHLRHRDHRGCHPHTDHPRAF